MVTANFLQTIFFFQIKQTFLPSEKNFSTFSHRRILGKFHNFHKFSAHVAPESVENVEQIFFFCNLMMKLI